MKFKFCRDTVEFTGVKLTPTGIALSNHILSAMKNFLNARSWFGLVNQVAWAYSTSPIMEPFRELVKHNATFQWNSTLNQLFQQSKELLISKVEEGITTFDINRPTCLQTDWSETRIGYLLLQKYCSCLNDHAPVCCSDGWRLVFAGSRFLTPTESCYSPTEGEALAVAWSLENARMFVLGCQNLITNLSWEYLTIEEYPTYPTTVYVHLKRIPFAIHSRPHIARVNGTKVQMLYPEIQHITHWILQYQHARMLQTSTLHMQKGSMTSYTKKSPYIYKP